MADSPWPLLEKRFPAGQYALFAEVSDAAGFSRSRSADGIAMSLWPSRGLGVEGIEIKSFRSDWLRELKMPEKAENIFKYCDRWWLLTTDDTIAKMEEIPATWGWMMVKGKRLLTMKEAPKLSPQPLTKDFIAAILKRASKGMIPAASIEDKIKEATEIAKLEAERNIPYQLDNTKKELAELQKRVTEFELASGVEITGWRQRPQKLGEAVKFIEAGGMPKLHSDLVRLRATTEFILKTISEGLESAEVFVKEEVDLEE